MYRFERAPKEERYLREMKSGNSPSFSSTLLDEIYRSIDECEPGRGPERRLCREASSKKQSTRSAQIAPQSSFSVQKHGSDKGNPIADAARRIHFSQELLRKPKYDPDLDSDALFFSSSSISSDSSSGAFSFSDTESVRGAKTTASSSCFAPFRLKPVRTRVAAKRDERQHAPLGERRESQEDQGGGVFRSAASRIYANLMKVKQQPVSPGGRLVSFINSFFSTTPKSAKRPDPAEANLERKLKSGQASSSTSAFSSVSLLSRPCLSKRSPSTRERFRSGAKRTVRFYPVSVIVDEDCRPCGHKCLYQEEGGREKQSSSVSLSVPTAWRIGKCQPKKIDQDCGLNLKDLLMEKSRRFEENARELLRDCRENQKKGFELKGRCEKELEEDEDEDGDDGGASCSSSDLFELDHLAAAINEKYNAELPVYETTYVDKCRVSGKGYRV